MRISDWSSDMCSSDLSSGSSDQSRRGVAGDLKVSDADEGQERRRVDVRHVDGQGVAAAHGDGALDAGSSEVLLGRLPRCGGVERDVAAFDGRYGLDLLPARARGLGSDVVSPLLCVDLATEIDREADENHRSEERRVGKAGVGTCRARWW